MLDCMHSDNISHYKKLPKKHVWIMLICCLAPLILIVALSSFGIIGSLGFWALILLCPILHLLLMRAIYRKIGGEKNEDK